MRTTSVVSCKDTVQWEHARADHSRTPACVRTNASHTVASQRSISRASHAKKAVHVRSRVQPRRFTQPTARLVVTPEAAIATEHTSHPRRQRQGLTAKAVPCLGRTPSGSSYSNCTGAERVCDARIARSVCGTRVKTLQQALRPGCRCSGKAWADRHGSEASLIGRVGSASLGGLTLRVASKVCRRRLHRGSLDGERHRVLARV